MRTARSGLPALGLLRAFEAAARHLSFTRAAEELFVTQSAVSRQIKSLEEDLGVPLFQRRHRSLRLTEDGQELYRATHELLERLADTMSRIGRGPQAQLITVSATLSFSAMWLVPRLSAFRAKHPESDVRIAANNDIIDADRERIDVIVRYCKPEVAPAGGQRLFGELVCPVAGAKLVRRAKLRAPDDLRHQVLLHLDDPLGRTPWLSWRVWFEAMKLAPVAPAANLYFSHYDQMIHAAIDGQGIALGRSPLLEDFLRSGKLVALFGRSAQSNRAYFVAMSRAAAHRPVVRDFVEWVVGEAMASAGDDPVGR